MATVAQSMHARLEAAQVQAAPIDYVETGSNGWRRILGILKSAMNLFRPVNSELLQLSEHSAADIGMSEYIAQNSREYPSQRVYDRVW